jgi:phenylpropionate dioxygenase-like ring-hydroxylating dioxygenase large terminal subunit
VGVVTSETLLAKPVVQSAWCPHIGADLSVGQVLDGRLRCAYHHWSFDRTGACAHIPSGDKIPDGARIFTYPAEERWGLVWVFNGQRADFPLPRIPDAEPETIEQLTASDRHLARYLKYVDEFPTFLPEE